MKWRIPAKTFLLGEYAAVADESAIVLNTSPYFELALIDAECDDSSSIHPESPAGLLWQQKCIPGKKLSWYDPYQGCGGLGASSAQFLATYWASCALHQEPVSVQHMLELYYQCSWSGVGLKPSGYDVIAQTQQGCVYINKKKQLIHTYDWSFPDLSFFLLHTGNKLATHHHLRQSTLPAQTNELSVIVDEAKQAFEQHNSQVLIDCINKYHQQLNTLHLVASSSLELIQQFRAFPEVLAIKGCGALGADVLLIITARSDALLFQEQLLARDKRVLATEADLTKLKNNQ